MKAAQTAVILLTLLSWTPMRQVSAQSFGSDTQPVTVRVAPITVIALNIGIVSLTIGEAQATPGQEVMTVVDESTRLLWGVNSSGRKITAVTDLATPLFELRLAAFNATLGTPGAEFPLSTLPRDLLLGIGRSTGSCLLRYTGVASATQGAGTDAHTITFTVVSQ